MFVQLMEGKVSDAEGIRRLMDKWVAELQPGANGYVGTTAGVTADGRSVAFARFESEAAARANSERPEQDAWWSEFEKCFDGPVSFAESSDVETLLGGGSDEAGFVQVMKVTGVNRARIAEADAEFEKLAAEFRPDLIGSVRVWTGPDSLYEANYFTSEQAARDGEKKEPPADVAEKFADFMAMMSKAEWYDFSEPYLHSA